MNLSEFKTEIKTATSSHKDDYFLYDVGSTEINLTFVNGYTVDVDINTHWIEDIETSIDYDSPNIDHSRNELELTEVNMYDGGGYNIDVTPDMLECIISWIGNYFECETY